MENLLGRIISVVLITIIFKVTIFSKKEEKRDGYIVASSIGYMNLSKILMILSSIFIIIVIFFANFKNILLILLIAVIILQVKFCKLFLNKIINIKVIWH